MKAQSGRLTKAAAGREYRCCAFIGGIVSNVLAHVYGVEYGLTAVSNPIGHEMSNPA